MLIFNLEPTSGDDNVDVDDDDDEDGSSLARRQSSALPVLVHVPILVSEEPLPNPVTSPNEYREMVVRIYQSSKTMMIGNMLEWLDFGIYGYSEQEISRALFANNNTAGWAAFGLGYAFRPIGAFVLGRLADSSSRRYAFQLAVVGMAASTAAMAILPAVCESTSTGGPSYCVAHVYTTAIPAVLLRCCQGFSAGAAAGGVNVIQSEASKSAQSVGVNNVSGAAASILSALIVFGLRASMGEAHYATWGWRLAFALVIPPSIFAAFGLGSDVHSTDTTPSTDSIPYSNSSQAFGHHQEEWSALSAQLSNEAKRSSTTKNPTGPIGKLSDHFFQASPAFHSILPVRVPLNRNGLTPNQPGNRKTMYVPLWLLITLSIYVQFAISSYNNLNIYMVQYSKEQYQISSEESTLMALMGKVLQLLLSPLAAGVADVFGSFTVCGVSATACTILAIPVMAANRSLLMVWFLVAGLLPTVSTFWILNAPLLVTSLFPKHHRSQGTSLVMAMGTGIAGFFPLVLHQLTVNNSATSTDMSTLPIQARTDYRCGVVLMIVAGLASAAIFWIRHHARMGNVLIYQRPDLI